jgi:hypothetical protein
MRMDTFMRQHAPPALRPILNAFPTQSANGIDYASGLAEFLEPYSLPSKVDSTSVRLDHDLRPSWSLFFRFSDTPSSTNSRTLSAVTQTRIDTQTCTVGATGQLGDRLTKPRSR